MFPENTELSKEISNLLTKDGFTENEIGLAVIDLNNLAPHVFGYNMDHFIYPASVYKIFIAAEALRQIEIGQLSLEQIVEIKSPNDVDKDSKIFPGDTRKILNAGENVSIDHLLDLMLTRSDNTASNTLIDVIGRENITSNIINRYNWKGSEITRKFLDRKKEDGKYQFSSTTLSCARHLVEFFYLVETQELVSPFVSKRLKDYMLHFDKKSKKGLWLANVYSEYYCKGGWFETNLYKHSLLSALNAIIKKGWAIIRWSNDAGVVTGQKSKYSIATLSVNKSISPTSYFRIGKLAKVVYDFMENKNHTS